MTCEVCDEPAKVLLLQPDELGGVPHPLCPTHLAQFAQDLLAANPG